MSSQAKNFVEQMVAEFEAFAAPLAEAMGRSSGLYDLLAIRGWNLHALRTVDLSACAALVDTLQQGLAELQSGRSFEDLNGVVGAIDDLGRSLDQLQNIRNTLMSAAGVQLSAAQAESLAVDLLEALAFGYLHRRLPRTRELLLGLTLIEIGYAQTLLDTGGGILRYPVRRPALRLENLGKLLSDPVAHLKSEYFPAAGITDEAAAVAFATRLFGRLEAIVWAFGGRAMAGLRDPLESEIASLTSGVFARSFTFAFSSPSVLVGGGGAALGSQLGATLAVVPASGSASDGTPGPALEVVPFGLASFAAKFADWTATLTTGGKSSPIVITAQDVRFADPAATRFDAQFDLSKGRPGTPALILGGSSSTRLQIDTITFSASVELAQNDRDCGFLLDLHKAALVVSAGEGDSFLKEVLPPGGMRTDFDLAIGWSHRNGLRFAGGAGLQSTLTIRKSILGLLELESVHVALRAQQAGVDAIAAATVTVDIGPLAATIERMGLEARFTFPERGGNLGPVDLKLGFKPPNGIGLVLDAGPVKGGGYLFFDPDEAMYAGAMQLSMKALSFSAVGVVTTRLPDGGDGFSMLVVITAEFPPIQLGFGFSLIGIGGLAGIHRDMDADALAQCLREGRLGSILFPRDVVANVRRIVDDIRTVFPPRRDRHVFGPMVKIGWGANALLEMDVAVLLSLPSPIVIAILGRMRAALPTREEAVIDLRLEVLGLIDLGRSRLTIEARLVDSRIAAFAVSGGMAMQLSWGATKTFALSVGGFNRRFLPPPDFHAPPRMAIALSSGENPTFTLSSYFALTSNAVQFGAAADFSMRAETFLGVFTLAAYAQFDVLLVFDPPFFAADLIAGIEVKRNGATLFLARLEASLTGPEPWRISGIVEVQIIVPLRIPFDHTLGQAETPTPAAGIALADLRRQLTDEIARAENWTALPAGAVEAVASMRRVEPMPGAALVHPLGGVGFRQRLLPLEKTLRRYGTANVSDPGAFAIDALVLGGSEVGRRDLFDDFAPGEFEPLSDDEKLSRPAFETFAAGIEAASMGVGLPSTLATTSGANFEETVINPDLTATDRLSTQLGLGLLQADRRTFGDVGSAAISVRPERYVLAERDTLQTAAEGEAAHAQCEDARRRGDAGARVTVPAHEAIVVFEP